jgi:hypothetical protein
VVGCRLVPVVRKLRPKKMTRVTFYVATAFATSNVRMLRLKQFRYIFLRIYAYMRLLAYASYVAVFLTNGYLNAMDANLRASQSADFMWLPLHHLHCCTLVTPLLGLLLFSPLGF